ncbi:phage protease [Nitrosomonas communis]|uniref:phage protease n=1 Tax=Nitrosomonas communis TaxID=44574 RepID=UPI003CC7AF9C
MSCRRTPYWHIDTTLAANPIAEFESHINCTMVDNKHQTLLAAQNGQHTPQQD